MRFDFRNEIISLAEKEMLSFVQIQIKEAGIEKTWMIGLCDHVNKFYNDHKSSYKKLYEYFQNNDENKLDLTYLESLDITALSAIINFYPKVNNVCYNFTEEKKEIIKLCINELRALRNTFDHYQQEINESEKNVFHLDQLYYVDCISKFAVLCMKYLPNIETWKEYYHKAKMIERDLQGERLLRLENTEEHIFDKKEDMSELLFWAEQGNVEAQLKAGKAYLYGERVNEDFEKAYILLRKAALNENSEAEYLLSLLYYYGDGTEKNRDNYFKWLESSAYHGFAPAQYKFAFHYILKENKTPDDKQKIQKWLCESAKQEYPPAVREIGMFCVNGDNGFKKDPKKSREILHMAAELGEITTDGEFAREAEKKKDYDKAIYWYNLALSNENSYIDYNDITNHNNEIKMIDHRIRMLKRKKDNNTE